MREFTSFAISFCGVLIAAAGIYMLLPEGKMSKAVKYIVVLTLLSALIGLFSVNFSIRFPKIESEFKVQDEYRDEKVIKAVFESALKMNNIEFEKIIIFTDKNEEGSITITKVQIYSSEEEQKIISAVGNSKEYDVEVIN